METFCSPGGAWKRQGNFAVLTMTFKAEFAQGVAKRAKRSRKIKESKNSLPYSKSDLKQNILPQLVENFQHFYYHWCTPSLVTLLTMRLAYFPPIFVDAWESELHVEEEETA